MFVYSQTDREALYVKCQIHTELYTKEIWKPYLSNLREFTTNTHTNREVLFTSCLYTVKLIGKPYLLKTKCTQNIHKINRELTHTNMEALFTLTNINEP